VVECLAGVRPWAPSLALGRKRETQTGREGKGKEEKGRGKKRKKNDSTALVCIVICMCTLISFPSFLLPHFIHSFNRNLLSTYCVHLVLGYRGDGDK
jgi:hypothetical protein